MQLGFDLCTTRSGPFSSYATGCAKARKALPAPKYRHLMTYYDHRFAQDMGLLFCLANTRMRREVNQAASAMVRSQRQDFEDLLKDAQADPKGVAAQDLLKKVLPFLNISSRKLF